MYSISGGFVCVECCKGIWFCVLYCVFIVVLRYFNVLDLGCFEVSWDLVYGCVVVVW